MNTKMIRYILCRMLGVEAVLLMIPVIVAALYQEMSGIAFLIPAGILLLLFFLAGVKKPEQSHIYGKEGMEIRCTCMDFMVFVWRNAFYDIRLYTKLHGCVF